MLDVLVFSQPVHTPGRWSSATFSMVFHGAVFGAFIFAASVARPPQVPVVDTALVFITPQEPQAQKPPEPEKPLDQPIVTDALRGFQTVVAMTDIPVGIPPVDLNEHFDPRDYSGKGVEGGTAEGVVIAPQAVSNTVYSFRVVQELPERLAGPTPTYPPMLQQAGIEGRVVLEFVVDTTGRVEQRSVRVVYSPNPAFDGPSVAAVRQTVFRPGRVNGMAVRVLVRMDYNFVLMGTRG